MLHQVKSLLIIRVEVLFYLSKWLYSSFPSDANYVFEEKKTDHIGYLKCA